jgi:tetratricopeptide (TPR) repeat protein
MSNDAIEQLLAEASRLYNEGDYRRATQKWEEVLSLDPENQKARESIKIASLLSDTWSEGGGEPAPEAAAPGPQSPQEIQLEEGLARIRTKIEARDFQGAFADCEALAPSVGDHDELKSLTDQARSGLEAEPFIKAALERAQKELQASNFEMVQVLCSKILSLDAGNRSARDYLVMAQRRTSGEESQRTAAAAPNEVPQDVAKPTAAQEAAPATPAATQADATEDPLAALGMELDADLSPMDLAGAVGEEATPVSAVPPPVVDAAATPAAQDQSGGAGVGASGSASPESQALPVKPPPEVEQEIDATDLQSIPIAGAASAQPVTRQGSEIIQDGSVYAGAEAGEEGLGPELTDGSAQDLSPELGDSAGGAGLIAELGVLPPIPQMDADTADPAFSEGPVAARRPRAPRPAAAPAREQKGGGGLLRAVASVLLLGALGAGGWFLYQTYFSPVDPGLAPADPPTGVAAAAGPSVEGGEGPVAQDAKAGADLDAAEAAAEDSSPSGEELQVEAAPSSPSEDPAARTAMAQARYQEARRQVRSGNLRQAKVVLEEALVFDPMLFEAKDLYDEISQQLLEAERFEQDIATVRRSMQDHDYHSALWKLYRLQESFPSVAGWDYNIASAWYNWGVLLLKAGNLREAMEKFDEVLGIYPNDHEAIRQRRVGERYIGRARDRAYHSYVDALDMRPFKPIASPSR